MTAPPATTELRPAAYDPGRAPRMEEPASESSGSISSGSSAWFLSQIGGNAALFAGVLIIARVLGPGGRGSIAFLTVLAQVMGYLAPFGISEATLVFVSKKPHARPKLLANLMFAAGTGAA